MEESWRFRPSQGNICPTCSISHYPFCSRPHPFDRFPIDPRPPPYHDPFSDNWGKPRSPIHPIRPMMGNPTDAYGISHNIERDPFTQHPVGIQRDDFYAPGRFHYSGHEYTRGEFSDRTSKRMRVGEMGMAPPPQMSPPPPISGYNSIATRLSIEDERRLNLIRDHGVRSNFGVDSAFRTGSNFVSQGGSQLHGCSYGNSFGDYNSKFEESRESEWKPSPPTSSFYEPRFGYGDRVGSMLHQEPSFDVRPDEKEPQRRESGLGFDQSQAESNLRGFQSDVDSMFFRNKEGSYKEDSSFTLPIDFRQQPQYAPYNSFHSGPSNVSMGAPNYVNTSQQYNDSSSVLVREQDNHFRNWGERSFSTPQQDDLIQQPHISHHRPNLSSQDSREKHEGSDSYWLHTKGFNQTQDFHQPHVSNPTDQLGSSASDVPYHEIMQTTNFHGQRSDMRQPFDVKHPPLENIEALNVPQNFNQAEQFGLTKINQGAYLPMSTSNDMTSIRQNHVPASQAYGVHPPLPPLPPPPLPMEPLGPPPSYSHARSSPPKTSSIYTIPVTSPASAPLLHPSAFEGNTFPPKKSSPDKPKITDASCLFKPPNRDTRPDHIVIILRGLPGSGKSYLAKMLRDLEVESGGKAPRIHSMDDYFMTEVEKVEESENPKPSGLVKGKKRITKKVMEYCYEPEMEEAYRSSMLKAFKKTLEEGMFTFIIVDDRNLRVADFAQFWASAKRSGYEVYLLEATYKDPAGCAARNVHGFALDGIKRMAELWEEAPSLYLRLDTQSLFSGDDLKEHGIQEVDMDMEDVACDEGPSGLHGESSMKPMEPPSDDCATHGSVKDEERWDTERDDSIGVKELGRSKWSHDADEEDIEISDGKGNLNALSGLIQAYSKGDKSVHWGDQDGKTGFSIGALKKANLQSLVIGPGAGYNLRTNPLAEEVEDVGGNRSGWESNKRNVLREQLQAESESFRAVFDRRRHRIGGLRMEDE